MEEIEYIIEEGEQTAAIVRTNNVQDAVQLTFTNEQIEAIKGTVAKGATTDQLVMFMSIAKKYGLDPFIREIVFHQGTIMTTRDGYLKIAHRNPDFEGMTSAAVHTNDEFEVDYTTFNVKHRYTLKDRGALVGAWACVYRKGMKPTIIYVPLSEYRKGGAWNSYPTAMIIKVAEAFALKRAFAISGLVTREEME